MAAQAIEIDVVANYRDNMSGGVNSSRTSVDRFTQSVERARREAERLGGTQARPSVSIVDRASATLDKIQSKAKSFAGKTFRAGVKIVDYATRPLRAIKNTLFSIKGLVAAVGAGLAAKQLIAGPIALADQIETAQIGFETMFGSAKKATDYMNKIKDFAARTPFETQGVVSSVQQMIRAGWKPEQAMKDIEKIGNAASAAGQGTEGVQGIVLALQQMRMAGKLNAQDMMQLTNRGVKGWEYVAKAMGKTIPEVRKMSEKGLIPVEKAIDAIIDGMGEYDGMMDKMSTGTVSGIMSNLKDTFDIKIVEKWGKGLSEGATKGLSKFSNFLEKIDPLLQKAGSSLEDLGKEISTNFFDFLEGRWEDLEKAITSTEFREADLFGKVKIVWDKVIAEPFGKWWDSKGRPYIEEKMGDLGELLGDGLTTATKVLGKGILTLLGVDTSGMDVFNDASSIGSKFADGFSKGFDADAVMKTIKTVFTEGFKSLFNGNGGTLGNIIKAGLAMKITSGILKGISGARKLWYGSENLQASGLSGVAGQSGIGYKGGLKGLIGKATTINGTLEGSGLIGTMAKFGNFLGSGAYTGNGLAAVGGGAAIGGIIGAAGAVKGISDLSSGYNSTLSRDKKHYNTRGGTKLAMVGTGAAAGAAIGSVVPVVGTAAGALIGAGIGGIGALWKGNDVADSISGVKKSTEELKKEAQELKAENMAKHFGSITLTADQLSRKVKSIIGADTIRRTEKYTSAVQNLETASGYMNTYRDEIGYTHERIMGKEKLSASDIDAYSSALSGYASSVKEYLSADKTTTRSAFSLLYGDDTKGMQKMTKGINKTYTKLEIDLSKKSKKLNDVISKAFEDGKITIAEEKKINELATQIMEIQDKVEQRIAKAESNASYDLIGKKYSNKDLTVKSYKELLSELDKQNEKDMAAADDAYITAKAKIDMQFEEGDLTKKQYDEKIKEIEEKYLNAKSEPIKKTVEISFEILRNNYSGTFDKLDSFDTSSLLSGKSIVGKWDKYDGIYNNLDKLKNASTEKEKYTYTNYRGIEVSEYRDVIRWNDKSKTAFADMQDNFLNSIGADENIRAQMADYYEQLKPQEEDLKNLKKSYEDLGKDVPQWINDSLANIEQVKLMSGDIDTFYRMIGEEIAKTDKGYAEELKGSSNVPKALKEGIEEGLKGEKVESIEVDTNLKVTADKKKIDTSNLDKATKDVVNKMKDKGILKITKDGKVKIKSKDGKIDTTGLDDKTKKAVEKMEKDGTIKINKDGTVTINPKKVETKKLDKATAKAANSLKKEKVIKITKDGKVTVNPKINYKQQNKKIQKQLDKLKKSGVITIDKKGNIKVTAGKIDTSSAKTKADSKTQKDVGKTKKVTKKADVTVNENSTDTSGAVSSTNKKISFAYKDPFGTNASVNVTTNLGSVFGLPTLKSDIIQKAKDNFGTISFDVGVSPRLNSITGGSTGGGGKKKKKKKKNSAYGRRVDSPILTWVGENNNREYIIPTTSGKRQRGLSLWMEAGKDLGVMNNADGGVYGSGSGGGSVFSRLLSEGRGANSVSDTEVTRRESGKNSVQVNVGGISIEITGSGDGAAADVANNKDIICNTIANALEEAFQNLPLATT